MQSILWLVQFTLSKQIYKQTRNITSSSLHILGFGGTLGFATGDGDGRDGFFGLDMTGLGLLGRGLLMGGSCWWLVRLSFDMEENNSFSKKYVLASGPSSTTCANKSFLWLQLRSKADLSVCWFWCWGLCVNWSYLTAQSSNLVISIRLQRVFRHWLLYKQLLNSLGKRWRLGGVVHGLLCPVRVWPLVIQSEKEHIWHMTKQLFHSTKGGTETHVMPGPLGCHFKKFSPF